jgi:hypothetical protein
MLNRVVVAVAAVVLVAACLGRAGTRATGVVGFQPVVQSGAPVQREYRVEGVYVEGCTCGSSCAADLTGVNPGCNAVGALKIEKGTFGAERLDACQVAFAVKGDAVWLFVDAPEGKQGEAEGFGRAVFGAMGTVKGVQRAKIRLEETDGRCTFRVDGASPISFASEPVIGGDGKAPVRLENTLHPLCRTLYQGKGLGGEFGSSDGFKIQKGGNAFFNPKLVAEGRV